MGNILPVIFHYFIDTQAGVVRVECLLLQVTGIMFYLLLSHILVYCNADVAYHTMWCVS